MAQNIYTRNPPTEYDRLRVQYPALWTYARVGGRLARYLNDWDQPAIDLLGRVSYVGWRTLDSFIDPLVPSLGAEGMIGLGGLRGAWRTLWLATSSTLARPNAAKSLSLTQSGTTLLGRLEIDYRVDASLPSSTWLDMGATMLTGLREG